MVLPSASFLVRTAHGKADSGKRESQANVSATGGGTRQARSCIQAQRAGPERLDWLEAQGRRGWHVIPRAEGWPVQVYARGRFATLRSAIDAAMKLQASEAQPAPNVDVGNQG